MLKHVGPLFVVSSYLLGYCLPVAVAARSSNGSSSNSGNAITITETEMKFTPNTFTVSAGQQVTIKLENKGVVMHDFTIDDVGGKKISQPVEPGKSGTVTFTAPSSPGTIQFYCSQPGHKAVGMVGTITVQ